jgi:hypothetical protein
MKLKFYKFNNQCHEYSVLDDSQACHVWCVEITFAFRIVSGYNYYFESHIQNLSNVKFMIFTNIFEI